MHELYHSTRFVQLCATVLIAKQILAAGSGDGRIGSMKQRRVSATNRALLALFGILFALSGSAQTNLLSNPGFETSDTTGWFAWGPCSLSIETNQVHSGGYAGLVTNRTDTWNGIARSLMGVLQPNQTYQFSVWLRLASGSSETMALTLQQADGSGTSYTWIASGSVSSNGWSQFSGRYTFAPSGTVSALNLYVEVPSSTNAAYFIDDMVMQSLNTTNGQCAIEWTNVFQHIDGFGASSAWGSSWTTNQAEMYFSTNSGTGTSLDGTTNFAFNGIGLSLLRNRIAPDGTTTETNIMRTAQARGARLWSTTWSPPAAYKDSGSVNGGNFLSAYNQPYASQLANYVLDMKTNYGLNIYAISVQNEPNYSTTNYESCLWTGQQFHDFLPFLFNALSSNGVGSTKIMIAESAPWSIDLANESMNDVTTSNMVGILASHDYDYKVGAVNTCGKPLWETEVSTFEAFDGSVSNGLYWAVQIHSFMTVAQANAWNFWWLLPYTLDNESLVDTNGVPAKRMYALGQYSRFVRPGYYRMDASNNGVCLISAYKDPNSGAFAVVAINNTSSDVSQTFNLKDCAVTNVTPWITSDTLSLAAQPNVGVTNSTFVYTLPAMSVVTFAGKAIAAAPSLSIQRIGSHIGITLNGDVGWNYTLLTSADSLDWHLFLQTNPPVMPITWFDTNAVFGSKFYRIQLGQQ
jgi:glucuronoarabinoxylan endo-1,4-beta-xylanase